MAQSRRIKHVDPVRDKICMDSIGDNVNMMVPWYLMASYAYYEQDDPILSDGMYDRLARRLLENFEEIEHMHKHLITEDDLRAGSLLIDEYPSMVKGAVDNIRSL